MVSPRTFEFTEDFNFSLYSIGTIEQVSVWLKKNFLEEYIEAFAKEQVYGNILFKLDNELLLELGVKKKLHRIRILELIQEIRSSAIENNNNKSEWASNSMELRNSRQHSSSSLDSTGNSIIGINPARMSSDLLKIQKGQQQKLNRYKLARNGSSLSSNSSTSTYGPYSIDSGDSSSFGGHFGSSPPANVSSQTFSNSNAGSFRSSSQPGLLCRRSSCGDIPVSLSCNNRERCSSVDIESQRSISPDFLNNFQYQSQQQQHYPAGSLPARHLSASPLHNGNGFLPYNMNGKGNNSNSLNNNGGFQQVHKSNSFYHSSSSSSSKLVDLISFNHIKRLCYVTKDELNYQTISKIKEWPILKLFQNLLLCQTSLQNCLETYEECKKMIKISAQNLHKEAYFTVNDLIQDLDVNGFFNDLSSSGFNKKRLLNELKALLEEIRAYHSVNSPTSDMDKNNNRRNSLDQDHFLSFTQPKNNSEVSYINSSNNMAVNNNPSKISLQRSNSCGTNNRVYSNSNVKLLCGRPSQLDIKTALNRQVSNNDEINNTQFIYDDDDAKSSSGTEYSPHCYSDGNDSPIGFTNLIDYDNYNIQHSSSSTTNNNSNNVNKNNKGCSPIAATPPHRPTPRQPAYTDQPTTKQKKRSSGQNYYYKNNKSSTSSIGGTSSNNNLNKTNRRMLRMKLNQKHCIGESSFHKKFNTDSQSLVEDGDEAKSMLNSMARIGSLTFMENKKLQSDDFNNNNLKTAEGNFSNDVQLKLVSGGVRRSRSQSCCTNQQSKVAPNKLLNKEKSISPKAAKHLKYKEKMKTLKIDAENAGISSSNNSINTNKNSNRSSSRPRTKSLGVDVTAIDTEHDMQKSFTQLGNGALAYGDLVIGTGGVKGAPGIEALNRDADREAEKLIASTAAKSAWRGRNTISSGKFGKNISVEQKMKNDLRVIATLGKGGGGTVLKAIHVPTLRIVAVKEVMVNDKSQRKQMRRELVTLLNGLNHPNVVQFYDSFYNPSAGLTSMVFEFLQGGSLQDIVDKRQPVQSEALGYMARDCLEGLQYLHNLSLLHRDIKPSNLLISHKGVIKIADFGITRELCNTDAQSNTYVGTFMYMSPERVHGDVYSYKSDVWAVCMSLLTCALGEFPFKVKNGYWGVNEAICNEEFPSLPVNFDEELSKVIFDGLNRNHEKRYCVNELLKSPYFESIKGKPATPVIQVLQDRGLVSNDEIKKNSDLNLVVESVTSYYRDMSKKVKEDEGPLSLYLDIFKLRALAEQLDVKPHKVIGVLDQGLRQLSDN